MGVLAAAAASGRAHAAASPRRSWLRLAATLALVAALVAEAHWPVLKAQALSFDDAAFVTNNPLVSHPGWASTRRFFTEVISPSTVRGYYLPLAMTSLMLDVAMGATPDNLRVFHATSLALHVVATLLTLLILYRLFGALVPAAIAALLFGLHPLTVEPIAWIGERKTLLASCFAFGAVLLYLEHVRRGRGAWLAAAVVAYLLALLSKPTVIMLPLLLLTLDWWPLRRLSIKSVLEKWPFALLALASGIVTLLSHQRTAGIDAFSAADAARWPVHAGCLVAFYLAKIVRPVGLSCAYPMPQPFALSNPIVALAIAAVVALKLAAWALARRTRAPLAGWTIFTLAIAPTLGLVKYSWVMASDKYAYFPAIGLLVALAALLVWLGRAPALHTLGGRVAAVLITLALLAAEARGVRAAIAHWSDSLTLCRHMESVAPEAPAVQSQLGIELERRGQHDEAITHLRRAVALAPNFGEAHYNLGVVLGGEGRIDEAIAELRAAAALMPADADTRYNLGAALALTGKLDEADAAFRAALAIDPNHVQALDQLGGLLAARGRVAEAVPYLSKAAALSPDDANVHYRLAAALLLTGGHAQEAIPHLEHAMRLAPAWPTPPNTLAWLLATSPDAGVRDPARAVDVASRAVAMTNGEDALVLDTMAAAQAATGNFSAAESTLRRAIALASLPGSRAAGVVSAMRERLALYGRRIAYIEPAPAAAPKR